MDRQPVCSGVDELRMCRSLGGRPFRCVYRLNVEENELVTVCSDDRVLDHCFVGVQTKQRYVSNKKKVS
jgi:hypothetical protein